MIDSNNLLASLARSPLPLECAPDFDAAELLEPLVAAFADTETAATQFANGAGSAIAAIASNSTHFRDLARLHSNLLCNVLTCDPDGTAQSILTRVQRSSEVEDQNTLMQALRRLRVEMALLVMLVDLGKIWNTSRVVSLLTEFADSCVRATLDFLLKAHLRNKSLVNLDPDNPGEGCGYFLLAMGKHGARELNYSSDIDVIAFFEPGRSVVADPGSASKLYVRITQALHKILQERTSDGYVFRVDLRLRPDPSATPVAVSVPAALHYYEARGQNWERAAMIKARVIAGDSLVGQRFLADIQPFIWRRFLDYSTVSDIQRIKRQIHSTRGMSDAGVLGQNVKLGPGGIREIEFFVQTQQLIAGGRHSELRIPETIAALRALATGGWISSEAQRDLERSYWSLRDVEHRLQMRFDEQTHDLPKDLDGLASVARLSGVSDPQVFSDQLRDLFATVVQHSQRLFAEPDDLGADQSALNFSGNEADEETRLALLDMGFERADDVARLVQNWISGRYAATRTQVSRDRLMKLIPVLLREFAETDNPDGAVVSFDRLLQGLPAGLQLFSLLLSNPGLLSIFTVVMGTAPRLADTIVARPHVLDALLEPEFFRTLQNKAVLNVQTKELLSEANSYEEGLDAIRVFGREQQLLIGIRMISETLSPVEAARAYSDLADVLISNLSHFVHAEFALKHGHVRGSDFGILAMGKLGSREMTPTSDLDLILLNEFDPEHAQSDGPRSLPAQTYFMRLTQRFVAAISAPTAQGTLYDVDFRLRPSGNSGPLATHLEAFARYQSNDAWTWEHMALTRARMVSGGDQLIKSVNDLISSVLMSDRDWKKLRNDALEMRWRLEQDRSEENPWDVKDVAGGLVDIEFIAQTLVLRHAGDHTNIAYKSTADTLAAAAATGLLERKHADVLCPAHRLYHGISQLQRLCVVGAFNVQEMPRGFAKLVCQSRGLPSIDAVTSELIETQLRVRDVFNEWFERDEARFPGI